VEYNVFMSTTVIKRTGRLDEVHPLLDHRIFDSGEQCQVILFDDDHNTYQHVVQTLMQVFSYSEGMADKITLDAHKTGKTIAQVEDHEKAVKHVSELTAAGLKAEVDSLGV